MCEGQGRFPPSHPHLKWNMCGLGMIPPLHLVRNVCGSGRIPSLHLVWNVCGSGRIPSSSPGEEYVWIREDSLILTWCGMCVDQG